ncbi:NAD-dependent epimerase/dehydratase family protein [Spiribacter salinus]|uniref:NAD-dependent epimerase/dehydratase family protein n=1 Tax=Spiribacter salinus TaxID=1335746 RepID=UPI001C977A8C|nr:NAD-dependent epimerase/dehydratase family protein [Spiribacter salinus]MBY5269437.1 NAD-dependent dehydratase [Spiribacter salinus]
MRVLILGGDGYLGWPTAMDFAAAGHEVTVADNYLRRRIAESTDSEALLPAPSLRERAQIFAEVSGQDIAVRIGDLSDPDFMFELFKETAPETVIHYAEQPSAPYSMRGFREARETFQNNLDVTFNCIWAVKDISPHAHIIKLGTMGEYGTPNIDIEEGWLEIEHKGRKDTFLYPRAAGSLYHTTKVLDTDLLWFYVRTHGLRVTDLMQGPVYGVSTDEADLDPRLCPNFHYDDIFGTVVNRFLAQAVAGVPLTVYGSGGQKRGYLNLRDTLQCIRLAADHPAQTGELRIFNQLTETLTVNELAERVQQAGQHMGIDVEIKSIANPRKEKEEHYYKPVHSGLTELGLEPHYLSETVLGGMLERIIENRHRIDINRIMPRVSWS